MSPEATRLVGDVINTFSRACNAEMVDPGSVFTRKAQRDHERAVQRLDQFITQLENARVSFSESERQDSNSPGC